MTDFMPVEKLLQLIGVDGASRYLSLLLNIGAIELYPFNGTWGGETKVDPKYKIIDQEKFDKVVLDARSAEAELRLLGEKQLSFEDILRRMQGFLIR
jgi:hypothetical protein